MLAHLSRLRLVRGNVRTGELEYQRTLLRWSGPSAAGDELSAPVCAVIEVGCRFVISPSGYLAASDWPAHPMTPTELLDNARKKRGGFILLYDEEAEELEYAE